LKTIDEVIFLLFLDLKVKEAIEDENCLFLYFADDPKDRTFRRYRDFSYSINNAVFAHTFMKNA